jgi:Fe-Mn family superoxide dismutase
MWSAQMTLAAPSQTFPFTLPALPFAYDALEPHLDSETLVIHHREHHGGYVKKLNEALAGHADLHDRTLEYLLSGLSSLPSQIQTAVRNNGGGHLNHDFFWNQLAPSAQAAPRGPLAEAISKQFGSEESFRAQFADVANKHFASGWTALAWDKANARLEIVDLPGHDILPPQKVGLLICDVWEHAYYLRYRNRRPAFLAAYWHVVNWQFAEQAFSRATAR